jgi:hypothetical protein
VEREHLSLEDQSCRAGYAQSDLVGFSSGSWTNSEQITGARKCLLGFHLVKAINERHPCDVQNLLEGLKTPASCRTVPCPEGAWLLSLQSALASLAGEGSAL